MGSQLAPFHSRGGAWHDTIVGARHRCLQKASLVAAERREARLFVNSAIGFATVCDARSTRTHPSVSRLSLRRRRRIRECDDQTLASARGRARHPSTTRGSHAQCPSVRFPDLRRLALNAIRRASIRMDRSVAGSRHNPTFSLPNPRHKSHASHRSAIELPRAAPKLRRAGRRHCRGGSAVPG